MSGMNKRDFAGFEQVLTGGGKEQKKQGSRNDRLFFMGTVSRADPLQVILDGDTVARSAAYARLNVSWKPAVGERVVLIKVNGYLIVLGAVAAEITPASEYVGELPGAGNTTHYLLLAKSTDTAVRINGSFYGARIDTSSARTSDEIKVFLSSNDAAQFSGSFVAYRAHDNALTISLVTIDYGGDNYVALKLETSSFYMYESLYFSGYHRNNTEFTVISSGDASNEAAFTATGEIQSNITFP